METTIMGYMGGRQNLTVAFRMAAGPLSKSGCYRCMQDISGLAKMFWEGYRSFTHPLER